MKFSSFREEIPLYIKLQCLASNLVTIAWQTLPRCLASSDMAYTDNTSLPLTRWVAVEHFVFLWLILCTFRRQRDVLFDGSHKNYTKNKWLNTIWNPQQKGWHLQWNNLLRWVHGNCSWTLPGKTSSRDKKTTVVPIIHCSTDISIKFLEKICGSVEFFLGVGNYWSCLDRS